MTKRLADRRKELAEELASNENEDFQSEYDPENSPARPKIFRDAPISLQPIDPNMRNTEGGYVL